VAEQKQTAVVESEERIANIVADAVVKVQERIQPTEKREASLVSPFNPEGLKVRPKLENRYIFCGAPCEENILTNEEVRSLNTITEPGTYRGGRWQVLVRQEMDGKKTIFINIPHKTIDERMDMPHSLLAIIAEIKKEDAKLQAPKTR
jgi:hypothetical protein